MHMYHKTKCPYLGMSYNLQYIQETLKDFYITLSFLQGMELSTSSSHN